MFGFDPELDGIVNTTINRAFRSFIKEVRRTASTETADHLLEVSKKIQKTFQKSFADWIAANHLGPILRIVDVLPKDELAELVETLISAGPIPRSLLRHFHAMRSEYVTNTPRLAAGFFINHGITQEAHHLTGRIGGWTG